MTGNVSAIRKRARKGNIAFWRHDRYPYLLHGTIVKVRPMKKWNRDDVVVETAEYGIGFGFKVAFILPPAAGKRLGANLDSLRAAYTRSKDEMHERFKKAAEETLGAEVMVFEQIDQGSQP